MVEIFQGVNKHNGETVAVKTFNQLSHMRPQEVQMREFEVLQKVKHENIVKLLAIEEEQEGRGKVIVMELCTGIAMKTFLIIYIYIIIICIDLLVIFAID